MRRLHVIFIIAFVMLCYSACSSVPEHRGDDSILVISALLPASGGGVYVSSQKLMLLRLKDGVIDTSVIFFTDEVREDLYYAYNVPPGCYVIAGCAAEAPSDDMNERLLYVFKKESALRCTVCVDGNTVYFAGRLHFNTLKYDPLAADDFQKTLLKEYNPMIITDDAHQLNYIVQKYTIYMCHTAFIERSAQEEVYERITEDIKGSSWNDLIPQEYTDK